MKLIPWLWLLILLSLTTGTRAEPISVITNPRDEHSSLQRQGLRAIFSMRLRSWPDGTEIRVFVLPDDAPSHSDFAKTLLGVFPHQLRRGWDRRVFSGTGQAPQEVPSLEAMKQRVAETPGSIGYVPQRELDETVRITEIE